ncbi:MAG: hypothetical protein AAFY82_03465 [Pseudomonadota bacterium]
MKRRIDKIEPFPFASDFSAPQTHGPETVSITAQDLALLLSDAQAGGAAIARNDALAAEAERLARTSEDLKKVLTSIVDLAAHLEQAAIDESDRNDALQRVRRLAAIVIEGQGDLFVE